MDRLLGWWLDYQVHWCSSSSWNQSWTVQLQLIALYTRVLSQWFLVCLLARSAILTNVNVADTKAIGMVCSIFHLNPPRQDLPRGSLRRQPLWRQALLRQSLRRQCCSHNGCTNQVNNTEVYTSIINLRAGETSEWKELEQEMSQIHIHNHRIIPLDQLDSLERSKIAYLPWFYNCNQNRYRMWEGCPDSCFS